MGKRHTWEDKQAIALANRILLTARKWANYQGWKKKDMLRAWSERTGKPIPPRSDYQGIADALCEYADINGIRYTKFAPAKRGKAKKKPKVGRVRKEYGGNETFTQWRLLRYEALKRSGGKCECCGATPDTSGQPLHVDHIKPKSVYPHLQYELSNLQVLCADCNVGKGNWDETNWRSRREEERATIALDIECGVEMRRRLN